MYCSMVQHPHTHLPNINLLSNQIHNNQRQDLNLVVILVYKRKKGILKN